MNRRRIWLLFTFIFVAGMLAGAAAMHAYFQAHIWKFMESTRGRHHEYFLQQLDKELQLTDAQHAQIEDIVTATHVQLQQLRQRTQPEADAIITRSHQQIEAHLTPTQLSLFQEILKHMPPPGSNSPPPQLPAPAAAKP